MSDFFATVAPVPEATITPDGASWTEQAPPPGFTVTLVVAGDHQGGDQQTVEAVARAVREWARRSEVALTEVTAADQQDATVRTRDATEAGDDLIIGVGAELPLAWDRYTAQELDQQFLMLGVQLPEPTANVTAVIWQDIPFNRTPPAAQAVSIGVTSVLRHVTGVVLQLT